MKLEVTKKHQRCISEAISMALNSPCAHKHGCVIGGNGKIYGKGYNNYRTQTEDGMLKNYTSCHAEIAAIRNLYSYKNRSNNHLKVAEENIICC